MSHTPSVTFPGADGASLAGLIVLPTGPIRAWALFAHCFTCDKDSDAARSIGDALAARGVAVLRFDFRPGTESPAAGLASNADDLVAAADWLRTEHGPARILIGHGAGGAAALLAAQRIAESKAVVSVAARAEGVPQETLAGLKRALLILHAPLDQVVGIDNARQLFVAAKHPKSFVSLDHADHLLSRPADGDYVGELIAAWVSRYLPPHEVEAEHGIVEVVGTRARYRTSIQAAAHHLIADEPRSLGGTDAGPGPYEFLLGALGACTTMTLRMYADRKGWPLEGARVRLTHRKVHAKDCADCETGEGRVDEIERWIAIEGDALTDEQRERLMEIADRCPVHRTLEGEIKVRTEEAE